ncbi:MAG: L,D-transpeptidase family protein [Clostridium sp.]|nr:L,D-transpeptidase family protein [Clostridium sp.]
MKKKRIAAVLGMVLMLASSAAAYAGPAENAGSTGSAQTQETADILPPEGGWKLPEPQSGEQIAKDISSVQPDGADFADLSARLSATETAKKTNQIILVVNHQLTMWNKGGDGQWTPIFWTYAGYGRNGLSADRTMGDETTPIGSFPLQFGFGLADNPGTGMEYRKIGPNSWWSGEFDKTFNTWVETEKAIEGEHLIGYDPQYKYAIAIGFNIDPVIYQKGCAIFLHVKNNEQWGTAGCVSTAEDAMLKILQAAVKGSYIIIVPDREAIGNY